MHQDLINLEMCTHARAHTVHAHKHAPWRLIVLSVSRSVWHGHRCPPMGSLSHVTMVCRCPWVCLDRCLGLFPAVGCRSRPTWGNWSQALGLERLAFVEHPPQVQHVAPGWEGEGPQRQRSPHCREPVPLKPKEWQAGPAAVRRLCRNLTDQGGAWTARGAPKRLRLIIVSGRAPWRCFPHAVSFHSWGRNCPRAPCVEGGTGRLRGGPWPRMTQMAQCVTAPGLQPRRLFKLVSSTSAHTSW